LGAVFGTVSPVMAGRMVDRLIRDAGIEPMLKSWVLIDNHDIPRSATVLPNASQRRLAQALQFTLPGAPNLYYGSEVGMAGGGDPENRAPMRWDLVRDDNPELVWIKHLIALRKTHRALRIGNFRLVEAERLLAFERYTNRALETVIVLANPSNTTVTERIMIANASLMDDTPMAEVLGLVGAPPMNRVEAAFMTVTVPPESVCVYVPREREQGGYSRYKRV
jgi:glycosidase